MEHFTTVGMSKASNAKWVAKSTSKSNRYQAFVKANKGRGLTGSALMKAASAQYRAFLAKAGKPPPPQRLRYDKPKASVNGEGQRQFVLLDHTGHDTRKVYVGKTPLQAARKAVRQQAKCDGPCRVNLRENGSNRVHVYSGKVSKPPVGKKSVKTIVLGGKRVRVGKSKVKVTKEGIVRTRRHGAQLDNANARLLPKDPKQRKEVRAARATMDRRTIQHGSKSWRKGMSKRAERMASKKAYRQWSKVTKASHKKQLKASKADFKKASKEVKKASKWIEWANKDVASALKIIQTKKEKNKKPTGRDASRLRTAQVMLRVGKAKEENAQQKLEAASKKVEKLAAKKTSKASKAAKKASAASNRARIAAKIARNEKRIAELSAKENLAASQKAKKLAKSKSTSKPKAKKPRLTTPPRSPSPSSGRHMVSDGSEFGLKKKSKAKSKAKAVAKGAAVLGAAALLGLGAVQAGKGKLNKDSLKSAAESLRKSSRSSAGALVKAAGGFRMFGNKGK